MRKIVYLAGLINPNVPESINWRDQADAMLKNDFIPLSPIAGKRNLDKDPTCIGSEGMASKYLQPKGLVLRDYQDVMRSDIILVNLNTYGSKRPLQGTLFELAWAWEHRTPVIAFAGHDDIWVQQHPFFFDSVTEWHDDLEGAVDQMVRLWT